jgi:hypothetical protein
MTCPRCSCPDCQAARLDPIEAKALQLRQACTDFGIIVTVDGYVDEAGAARLLSRSRKTLKNQRHAGMAPPHRKLGKVAEYRLEDLAAALVEAENS